MSYVTEAVFNPFRDATLERLAQKINFLDVATTGYDGDPNGGGAPAIIANAPIGTEYQQITPSATTWKKSPSGTWLMMAFGAVDFTSISSDVLPSIPDTYNVGSASYAWDSVFANRLRLQATLGAPATPQAGDMWVGSGDAAGINFEGPISGSAVLRLANFGGGAGNERVRDLGSSVGKLLIGYTYSQNAGQPAYVLSSGSGNLVFGTVFNYGTGFLNEAKVEAFGLGSLVLGVVYAYGSNGRGIVSSDSNAPASLTIGWVYGSNGQLAEVDSFGRGSLTVGTVYTSYGLGRIRASGWSSFAGGYAGTYYGAGGATISAADFGSMVFGAVIGQGGGSSGVGLLETNAVGSFALGAVYTYGYNGTLETGSGAFGALALGFVYSQSAISAIFANGRGSLTQGAAIDAIMTSSGDGSFAQGLASGYPITASGSGSFASGDSTLAAISATASNAVQFGPGSNTLANSFKVGSAGIHFLGTTGPPGSPVNGQQWVNSSGEIEFRSNGVTITLKQSAAFTPTNVSTDRSFDANSTNIDEIADVLGTVIADLQATGILA